jgi:hypothetical protein
VAYFKLAPKARRRDGWCCQACGTTVEAILTVHHVIPVELRGRDILSNLRTLCANCHRLVHWLATGDRSLRRDACGVGQSTIHTRNLLALARRIRSRRLRLVGPGLKIKDSVSLHTAIGAVIKRNGLEQPEAVSLRRCLNRALCALAINDRKNCSVRLERQSRFISVNANNHQVLRAPAWNDRGKRYEEDVILIWPHGVRPRILSPLEYRHAASGRFKLVPCINLYLSWEKFLSFSARDLKLFREACHRAFSPATRRWTSNVILE